MIEFWAAAIIVFLIIEGVTVALQSTWFALGALAALLSALFGAPVWLQVIWFVVVSAAALYFTRPLVKKYINAKRQPTNADRMIGMAAIVTERIDNVAATGAVQVGGKRWTARSAAGEVIEEGTIVEATVIEGVKLIVKVQEEMETETV